MRARIAARGHQIVSQAVKQHAHFRRLQPPGHKFFMNELEDKRFGKPNQIGLRVLALSRRLVRDCGNEEAYGFPLRLG